MPRNGSGVYSLPAGNPVTPLTVIMTSWANPTLTDIGNELTNSLSRDGFGGMRSALKVFDGTQLLPGLSFANEVGMGWYRESAGLSHLVVANTKVMSLSASKASFPAEDEHTGATTFKDAGAKSWLVQNQAGLLAIMPSTSVDDDDWDAALKSTWDPDTGAFSAPSIQFQEFNILSGNPAVNGELNIGRTVVEYTLATVGVNDDFFTGSLQGDNVVAYGSQRLLFGSGTSALNGTLLFAMENDGRFYGMALHNNAGDLTGDTKQYIASGTYAPTIDNLTNLTSPTNQAFQWTRVGNVVTVSGGFLISVTAGASSTGADISLPIPSTLSVFNAAGSCRLNSAQFQLSDSGSVVRITGTSDAITGLSSCRVHFTYLVD